MTKFLFYSIGIFLGVVLSAMLTAQANAQDDIPPPNVTDCAPVVVNQYEPAGLEDNPETTVQWGDGDGDGNAGDMIISETIFVEDEEGQLVAETTEQVIVAQWTTTCQLQQTCTEPTPAPCANGAGGGSSGGNSENCPGPTPTPCPNGSGGMGGAGSGGCLEPTPTAITPPVPPSYVVNPDIDAPPDCALIQVTEYGMKCYPTCTTSTTEGGVACLGVQREPYPRGLVGVPNVYIVHGPFAKEGNTAVCPDPNLQNPLYRNRTLKVTWEMDMTIPPAWFFDERPWNIQKGVSNQAFGFEVEHTFETSSYPTYEGDKPFIGPSTTNELLPAYLVRVDTWWLGYVVKEWDEYFWDEKWEEYSCDPNRRNPDGSKVDANCGDDGVGRRLVSREYKFKGHMTSKDSVDLRTWGWPTGKLYSRSAWDPRQSVIGIPPQYLCRYIPTPILEAQSVLTTSGSGSP